MSATRTVYDDVREERARQDAQWGGRAHDDAHTAADWRGYRMKFEDRAQWRIPPAGRSTTGRDALVKIAALAVAQIEALDRRSEAGK